MEECKCLLKRHTPLHCTPERYFLIEDKILMNQDDCHLELQLLEYVVHVQAIAWSFLTRLLCIWLPLEIFDLKNDTSTLSSNASRIDKRLALLPNCKINLFFHYADTPRV